MSGSIPDKAQDCSPDREDRPWEEPTLLFIGHQELFLAMVTRPMLEADLTTT
jgi:hypothetical protein